MSASATARIILEVVSTVTDKEKRQKIYYICLIPLGLICIFFAATFISPEEDTKLYTAAIQSVKTKYDIPNSIDCKLIRSIYLLSNESSSTANQNDIASFIENYFIKEKQYADQEDNKTGTVFLEHNEILERLKDKPFSLPEDTIDVLTLIYKSNSDLFYEGKFPFPCDGEIGCAYGQRIHPITGKPEFHTGVDICGEWHRPIKTIADGKVVQVNNAKSGYGNFIMIEHEIDGEKFYSFYAHLSQTLVNKSDTVMQGQQIGVEGGSASDSNPGTSTGHHLHFEIRKSPKFGDTIDPAIYLLK
ncbi:M23 family metallopeptidase [Paludicola sp. MB14-C6]|uniref:M23 family metallopeptidase n=1 Tax=Paludihabitans sp. MB14-C6 TaxID=3070656 RepID=UPI0027DCF2A5|nr:M23 family metallopeptidase [Paludicola sp. MB14-C6]WMJ24303.1 M23 family metallopeptidase [Paludicola sp. MB14-C6]